MTASSLRLFVEAPLASGAAVEFAREQAHYLRNVMRAKTADRLRLFNGRDGEWIARLTALGKSGAAAVVEASLRPQMAGPDLWLLFAPIKRAPIDEVATKATELGVAELWPVTTERTVVHRVNGARLRAHTIEAAEQCERLVVPKLRAPVPLFAALADWPMSRPLFVCAESGPAIPIATAVGATVGGTSRMVAAFLVGPEGGFSPRELDALLNLPFVTAVALGNSVLRADTAALAALACWQAIAGDWRDGSAARGR